MIAEACGCAPVSADPSAADFRFGRGFGPLLPLGTALAGTEAGTLQRAVVNMKSSATGARPHDGSLGASEFLSACAAKMEARSASASSSSEDTSSSKIVVEWTFVDFLPVAFADADRLLS